MPRILSGFCATRCYQFIEHNRDMPPGGEKLWFASLSSDKSESRAQRHGLCIDRCSKGVLSWYFGTRAGDDHDIRTAAGSTFVGLGSLEPPLGPMAACLTDKIRKPCDTRHSPRRTEGIRRNRSCLVSESMHSQLASLAIMQTERRI